MEDSSEEVRWEFLMSNPYFSDAVKCYDTAYENFCNIMETLEERRRSANRNLQSGNFTTAVYNRVKREIEAKKHEMENELVSIYNGMVSTAGDIIKTLACIPSAAEPRNITAEPIYVAAEPIYPSIDNVREYMEIPKSIHMNKEDSWEQYRSPVRAQRGCQMRMQDFDACKREYEMRRRAVGATNNNVHGTMVGGGHKFDNYDSAFKGFLPSDARKMVEERMKSYMGRNPRHIKVMPLCAKPQANEFDNFFGDGNKEPVKEPVKSDVPLRCASGDVPLRCASGDVPLRCAPSDVPLRCASGDVLLRCAPSDVSSVHVAVQAETTSASAAKDTDVRAPQIDPIPKSEVPASVPIPISAAAASTLISSSAKEENSTCEVPPNSPKSELLASSCISRSLAHGALKDNKIMYVNLTGRDISVIVKRKSGERELEFYPSGGKLPEGVLVGSVRSQYNSEYGMKVITGGRKSILDIMNIMNWIGASHIQCCGCGEGISSSRCEYNAIAFIVDTETYAKIDWMIPDMILRGKRMWVFSPGKEIIGGDAICGHDMYDSFVAQGHVA